MEVTPEGIVVTELHRITPKRHSGSNGLQADLQSGSESRWKKNKIIHKNRLRGRFFYEIFGFCFAFLRHQIQQRSAEKARFAGEKSFCRCSCSIAQSRICLQLTADVVDKPLQTFSFCENRPGILLLPRLFR